MFDMEGMHEMTPYELRDAYIAAINRRIEADTKLLTLLRSIGTGPLTREQAEELHAAFEADRKAEEALLQAREAAEKVIFYG